MSGVPVDVLLLDADLRQMLVSARVLGRAGLRVGAAERDIGLPVPTFSSRWCAEQRTLPDFRDDADAFISRLGELIDEWRPTVVIPSHDGTIAAIRVARDRLEGKTSFALAADPALAIAVDKTRTLSLAEQLGIGVPRSVEIRDGSDIDAALAEVGLPAVIKPTQSWVHGATAKRMQCVAVVNADEARQAFAELQAEGGAVVAQELLQGRREAVSLVYAGKRVWAEFAQYAHRMSPALGGSSVFRESIAMPADLQAASHCLIEAIGLEGYAEIEFRRDAAGRARLMEINSRLSASIEVAVRSGVDFPLLVFQWAAGLPMVACDGYRTGVRARWLPGDVSWLLENLTEQGRPDLVSRRQAAATFLGAFGQRAAYDYVDHADLRPALVAARVAAGKGRGRVQREVTRLRGIQATVPARHSESDTDVAVIGAGPYGLSIAAHLQAAGIDHVVLGDRMGAWRNNMPAGMRLKSEAFASNLSSPDPGHTLAAYCRTMGISYSPMGSPTAVEDFVGYGDWFADHLRAPVVEDHVVDLAGREGNFLLKTEAGTTLRTRRVVVAVGTTSFAYTPGVLTDLARQTEGQGCSHSSEHPDLSTFSGRRVVVVGAGQSGLETAALLHEHGADVTVVVRKPDVHWSHEPASGARSLAERVRRPANGLTPGWKCLAASHVPGAYRYLPEDFRMKTFISALGPTGAWWLRDRVEGRVPLLIDTAVESATEGPAGVALRLRGGDGTRTVLTADHVIAATGYRVDLSRLWFLGSDLRADIDVAGNAPVLSTGFETTVPGLYFAGFATGPVFGPVMRFVLGADYTARHLARQLSRSSRSA